MTAPSQATAEQLDDVGRCPRCDKPVGRNQTQPWCLQCERRLPDSLLAALPGIESHTLWGSDRLADVQIPESNAAGHIDHGTQTGCIVLGVVFVALGFYFLISPSEGEVEILGRTVVNLHRLALGQTSAIVGAIFLAAGIRPR